MSKQYQIFKQVDFKKVNTPEFNMNSVERNKKFEYMSSFNTPRSEKVRPFFNDNGTILFYKVNRRDK
jgi:hypothetical protein